MSVDMVETISSCILILTLLEIGNKKPTHVLMYMKHQESYTLLILGR